MYLFQQISIKCFLYATQSITEFRISCFLCGGEEEEKENEVPHGEI